MKKDLTKEIAVRQNAIDFYSVSKFLPNPDPILKKQGKDISVYNELLSDAHLGGCVASRKSGVLSLLWSIDRGKALSRQNKIIEEVFAELPIENIIAEMLNAPLFGYQVLEVLWEKVGGYILPVNIVGKPQEWFTFSEDNILKLKTKKNWEGEFLPERKFLLLQHESTYKNPYGFPLLSRCFWPITFKRGGLKFWVMFTEKYGMPFLVGKHPRGTQQQETDKFADMLESMIQDAIAVIPDDSNIEIHEALGKGASADIYERLINFCKSEISIAILGQNLTTEISGGSYAAAMAHMQVRKDIVDSDRRLVEKAFNRLIKWIYEINFNSGDMPAFSMWAEEDVDAALAERDAKLTSALEKSGLKLTKKYYQKYYGLDDDDIVETKEMKETEFAETSGGIYPDQDAIDELVDSFSAEKLNKQMKETLKPIFELLEECKDYNELMERLMEIYPEINTGEIEKLLHQAMFISELWGRLSIEKD